MADAIVINYDESYGDSPRKIWDDVKRNNKVLVSYEANQLQMELYECQLEDSGTILAFSTNPRRSRTNSRSAARHPQPRK